MTVVMLPTLSLAVTVNVCVPSANQPVLIFAPFGSVPRHEATPEPPSLQL
ncbi:MAG TPA: hypothetical protein VG223_00640 [Solirubrobacteraceae bacterium]|nr:hypothetical protein [Solirubrobacteraceae bacterium]